MEFELLKYQQKPVEQLYQALITHGGALDASDTGTGKTYVAAAVAKKLGVPVGVLCTKASISKWKMVLEQAGVKDVIFVKNYEAVRGGKDEYIEKVETSVRGSKKKKVTYRWFGDIRDGLIIFDEVHRCKGRDSQNGALLSSAKAHSIRCLMLSASAAENPLEMKNLGAALSLFKNKEYWPWCFRYGVTRSLFHNGFIWEARHSQHLLKELHKEIFPEKGTRIQWKKLDGQKAASHIQVEYVDIAATKKLDAAFQQRLLDLDFEALEAENDLTFLLYERKRLEYAKIPAFIELANDGIEQGYSVCIFVNFTETLKELSKRLKCETLVFGEQTPSFRNQALGEFQTNQKRLIILNTKAGGISIDLHDLEGNHPRLALISPTYSAVDLLQVLGRVDRAGAKSPSVQKIVFAANTVEEDACRAVEKKIQNIEMINDGDLRAGLFNLTKGVKK